MSIQPISMSLPPQNTSIANLAAIAPTVLRETKIAPAPAQDLAQNATKPISQNQLETAVKSVREFIQPFNNSLEFSINDETNQVVVKIVDNTTQEVIQQIPSVEMIAMAKALDSIKGLFVKQQA